MHEIIDATGAPDWTHLVPKIVAIVAVLVSSALIATLAAIVFQALPWTLALVGVTTILAFVLGTLIGLAGAWRRGGFLDSMLPPIFVITSAFPYFWLALISIWLFAIKLHWLPANGGYNIQTNEGWTWAFISDALRHSIPNLLPATRSELKLYRAHERDKLSVFDAKMGL